MATENKIELYEKVFYSHKDKLEEIEKTKEDGWEFLRDIEVALIKLNFKYLIKNIEYLEDSNEKDILLTDINKFLGGLS